MNFCRRYTHAIQRDEKQLVERKDLMTMFFMLRTNAYTFEKDLPVETFHADKVTKNVYLRDGELKEKEFPKSVFLSVRVDKKTATELNMIFSNKEKEGDEKSYKDDINNEINCVKIGARKFYFARSNCKINYLNDMAHIVVKEREDV